MRVQWNGRRFALVGLVGLASVLGFACASGPSQEDFDAMKQQVAALVAKDQEAATTVQTLATKLDQNVATRAQFDQTAKDLLALSTTAGTHMSKIDSQAALDAAFNKADTKLTLWAIQPGTAPRMNELTHYFNNMWFAAQARNWVWAEFEVYRTDETIKAIKVVRPKRVASMDIWMRTSIEPLRAAVKANDIAAFEKAYDAAVQECNNCHIDSEGGGISLKGVKITRPTAPIYSNVDYKGN